MRHCMDSHLFLNFPIRAIFTFKCKAPCKDAFQFPSSNYHLFLLHNFCLCGFFDFQHPPSSWCSMTPCVPLFPASCIYSTPFSALILHLFFFSQFPLLFSKSTSLFLISFSRGYVDIKTVLYRLWDAGATEG